MFVLSAIATVVPAVLACVGPGPFGPSPPSWDLLAGAPVTPDGRAQVLTADAYTVCWWSVDEDGETEVHRVWPVPGPHGVALVALEDGTVLVAMRSERRWAVLRVDPMGMETAFPVPGGESLTAFRAEDGEVILVWEDAGVPVETRMDVRDGCVLAFGPPTRRGRPDGSQSPR
jgi:hypothetical protein